MFNDTAAQNINWLLQLLLYNFFFIINHFSQAAVSIKIRKLHICFCSFHLSCPILEKDNFIKYLYIVLSCLIAFFFNLVCLKFNYNIGMC